MFIGSIEFNRGRGPDKKPRKKRSIGKTLGAVAATGAVLGGGALAIRNAKRSRKREFLGDMRRVHSKGVTMNKEDPSTGVGKSLMKAARQSVKSLRQKYPKKRKG